jgi:hypothetical protein
MTEIHSQTDARHNQHSIPQCCPSRPIEERPLPAMEGYEMTRAARGCVTDVDAGAGGAAAAFVEFISAIVIIGRV